MLRTILLSCLLLAPASLIAQEEAPAQRQQRNTIIRGELEAVISEANKLDDKTARVQVLTRAATLVSFSDQARSEVMFLDVWKFAREQADKDFNQEQALAFILKSVFPRNPKLARKLMSDLPKIEESTLQSRMTGRDTGLRRTAKLAAELVDVDPSTASAMLEQSLSTAVTPAGYGALVRLREKDPLLADFVVAKSMQGLQTQPSVVSLTGLHLLSAYVFPCPEAPVYSIEAESSLQSLQFEYFATAYDVFKNSLAETNEALRKDQLWMTLWTSLSTPSRPSMHSPTRTCN